MRRNVSLFRTLLAREIRDRYLNSVAGLLWVLLLPMAQLTIYAYVFVEIFKARVPEAADTGFLPYLAVAFWPWAAFAESLTRATTAIVDNHALIGKVALPHQILVLVAVSAGFALNFVGYLAVLLVLWLVGVPLQPLGIPITLIAMVMIYAFALGAAMITSASQVFIRDLSHALSAVLLLWFFATPIIYSPELVPEQFAWVLLANPFAHYVDIIRQSLLFGQFPSGLSLSVAVLSSLTIYAIGYWYFHRLSPKFEDYL